MMHRAALIEFVGRFSESWVAIVSLVITLGFLFCALFAPLLSPTNPYDLTRLQLIDALKPMGSPQVVAGEELRATFNWSRTTLTAQGDNPGFVTEPCGDNCVDIRLADVPAPLLVCFSHLRWDFVWQRPQHLLMRAAKHYRVVVVEEPAFKPSVTAHIEISHRPGGITGVCPWSESARTAYSSSAFFGPPTALNIFSTYLSRIATYFRCAARP
jgi:hypothetical protein